MKVKSHEQRDKVLTDLGIIWMSEIETWPIQPKLPKNVKGMIKVGIIPKFPIDPNSIKKYFISDYDNPGRPKSIKESAEHIVKIANMKREGKWEPQHHIPPSIEWMRAELFKYLTGHMTRKGAHVADETVQWTLVVEFVEEDGFTADFWREIWQSNENRGDDSYVKLERSDEDIITQVVEMVNKGTIKPNDEYKGNKPTVSQTLDEMKITDHPKAVLLSKILIELGLKHLAVEPKTPEEVQKDVLKYQTKYPDYFFAGASYSEKSQPKRDLEVARKFAEKFIEDPYKYNSSNFIGLVGVAGKATQKIKDVRQHKIKAVKLDGIIKDREMWRKVDELEKETGKKFDWKSKNLKQTLDDPEEIKLPVLDKK
jgi:hypothetical protein|tara:strand:+ start:632 stop:1738 length:1107 start_codon:yes stop_codon:yes gene_type:complete